MKQEVLQASTETLRFTPPWQNNRPTVASAATVVLKDPSGTTIQASANVTAINSTTGELTYTLTTAHTATRDENYVAEWSYVVSTVTYKETTLFDVVLHRLSQLTTDEDLYTLQGDLRVKNENVSGTVSSAATGTLVDTNLLKEYPDDYFNNGIVEAMNPSTGAVQRRTVTDFVQSTGSLSVSPNWSTTPDSTYKYIVYKPFRVKLDFAWEMLMNDVKAKGFRPALIMQSDTLKHVHAFKTLELVCMDFIKSGEADDLWTKLADRYAGMYNDAFGKILFQYDEDEDGAIGGAEQNQTPSRLKMVR